MIPKYSVQRWDAVRGTWMQVSTSFTRHVADQMVSTFKGDWRIQEVRMVTVAESSHENIKGDGK